MGRKHIGLGNVKKDMDRKLKSFIESNLGRPAVRPISTVPPVKVGRCGGMLYDDLGVLKDDEVKAISNMAKESILSEYMKPYIGLILPTYNAMIGCQTKIGEMLNLGDVIRFTRQISLGHQEKLRIRAEDQDEIIYLTIRSDISKPDERQLWFTSFNKASWVSKVYALGLNLKNRSLYPVSLVTMYMGKREKDTIDVIRSDHMINMGFIGLDHSDPDNSRKFQYYDWHLIEIMGNVLKWFVQSPESYRSEVTDPIHPPVEMHFFERTRREVSEKPNQAFFIYQAQARNSKMINDPEDVYNILSDCVLSFGPETYEIEEDDEKLEVPLVDFNEKEGKYISKYIADLGLFDGENSNEVDLVEKLSHPRYGTNLRIPVRREDGSKETFLMSYFIDETHNLMRIYAFLESDNDVRAVMLVDFENVRHFQGVANFSGIYTGIALKKHIPLFHDMKDIKANMPDCFLSFEDAMMLVYEMLSIHIVIYDRPQRTRMVRCQEEKSSTTPKKHSNKQRTEPEYIVRRILKPVKEAKELVRLSEHAAPGSPVKREYTMEEWERVGHWRRIPGTDRFIWIEKTTCRRKLPLSDKEIHIKL